MDMDYASGGDTVHSGILIVNLVTNTIPTQYCDEGGLGLLPGVISTLPSNGGGGGVLRPNTAAAVGGMADGDGMYGKHPAISIASHWIVNDLTICIQTMRA